MRKEEKTGEKIEDTHTQTALEQIQDGNHASNKAWGS